MKYYATTRKQMEELFSDNSVNILIYNGLLVVHVFISFHSITWLGGLLLRHYIRKPRHEGFQTSQRV